MTLLSNAEAQMLLDMPKKIVVNDDLQDIFKVSLKGKINDRFPMQSLDGNQTFLLQVTQRKENIKIDFHFQENDQYIGLLRIDYHSPHKNPEFTTDAVPSYALPYCGKYITENHVHFYVEGFKPLTWAVPLSIYNFSVPDIQGVQALFNALDAFCDKIGLRTRLQYEERLFL